MVRWFVTNLGTLLLAFVLAIVVWVVATTEQNPPVVQRFPEPIPIELKGLREDLVVVGPVVDEAEVTIRAPSDVWASLTRDAIHLEADLTGLGPGQHEVPLTSLVDVRPAQVVSVSPASLRITVEPLARREVPVRVRVGGVPAVGYQAGDPEVNPLRVSILGPESLVEQVSEVVAPVDVEALKTAVDESIGLIAVDANGDIVASVQVTPAGAQVRVPIDQLGGFKDVAVKIHWTGTVAFGYRLTNISVSPPIVTVFSSEPSLVDGLAGFVETLPVNLGGKSDDVDECMGLDLPEGVDLVGVDCVSVLVGIAAIESSLTVQRAVEVEGLSSGLRATPAPAVVDVILSGPLPVLDALTAEDVRVVLNLTGFRAGTYQVEPAAVLPDGVTASAILPATIEVVIATTTGGN